MTYTQHTLLPDEKILYATKPHYIVFYPVILWFLFSMLAMVGVFGNAFIGGLLLIMSVISLVGALISYYCSEYVVTSKRVLIKVGFIRRKSLEIFLERIEGIYVEQSVVGRMLNFGTVIISGIGGTKDPFLFVPRPLEFRSSVHLQTQSKKPE